MLPLKCYIVLTVPSEKSKIDSFTSSKMKKIVVLPLTSSLRFRFPLKLIYCIAFELA